MPHRTAGCGKSSLRPLMAGSSPSLPDGSNPSAAIVQSASDVQCSRLLKTTASLAQHPVAVTQNKRVKGFFFIIIVSVRVISPRRVAGRSAVSFSVMPALLLYPPAAHDAFRHREIAIPCGPFPVPCLFGGNQQGFKQVNRHSHPLPVLFHRLSVPSPGRLTRPTQAVVLPV